MDGRTTDRQMCPPAPPLPSPYQSAERPSHATPTLVCLPGLAQLSASDPLSPPLPTGPASSVVSCLVAASACAVGERGPGQVSAALSVPPRSYLPITLEAWPQEGVEQPRGLTGAFILQAPWLPRTCLSAAPRRSWDVGCRALWGPGHPPAPPLLGQPPPPPPHRCQSCLTMMP